MESHARVRSFLIEVWKIFIPSSVAVTFTINEGKKRYIQRFRTSTTKGSRDIDIFFNNVRSWNMNIEEVSITTTPGTIREHSAMYPRKPAKTLNIFDMNIDLLPCNPKPTEVQEVELSSKGLRRNGKNIKELPLENLRKVWNENPDCPGIEMPCPSPAFVLETSKRNYLSY